MRQKLLAGLMLLALAGCGKKEAKPSEDELAETPQIASLEDYNLPVDKSDQITAIDAATGDASGMPRDGGKVIELQKEEEEEELRPGEPEQATSATNATTAMSIPEIAAPPPPTSAPALTVPLGN